MQKGERIEVTHGVDAGKRGYITREHAGRKPGYPWPYWVGVKLDDGKQIQATIRRLKPVTSNE